MSRIAKKPLAIPEKTTVTVVGMKVTVKGPKGTLTREFPPVVTISATDKEVNVAMATNDKTKLPMWGTVASHIRNMIAGVNQEFSKKLLYEGVGYKADMKGKTLVLALGFSHPVEVNIPEGLTVKTAKGEIEVTGIDKEMVGSFCANVRGLKKPEPYKGKGIRYSDEVIRRKQGKKAA
jgi:large subunit ribosomal protein L6